MLRSAVGSFGRLHRLGMLTLMSCLDNHLVFRQRQAGTAIGSSGIGAGAIGAGIMLNAAILRAAGPLGLHVLQILMAGFGIEDAVLDQIRASLVTEVPTAGLAMPVRLNDTVFGASGGFHSHIDCLVLGSFHVFFLGYNRFRLFVGKNQSTDIAPEILMTHADRIQFLQHMIAVGLGAFLAHGCLTQGIRIAVAVAGAGAFTAVPMLHPAFRTAEGGYMDQLVSLMLIQNNLAGAGILGDGGIALGIQVQDTSHAHAQLCGGMDGISTVQVHNNIILNDDIIPVLVKHGEHEVISQVADGQGSRSGNLDATQVDLLKIGIATDGNI